MQQVNQVKGENHVNNVNLASKNHVPQVNKVGDKPGKLSEPAGEPCGVRKAGEPSEIGEAKPIEWTERTKKRK